MNWKTQVETNAEFQLNHFVIAMETFINEPNYISKALKRAEILSDSNSSGLRIIYRKLVPAQERDPTIIQKITINISHDCAVYEHEAMANFTDALPLSHYPFFYPKYQKFQYVYENNTVLIRALEFPDLPQDFKKIWSRILKFVVKFSLGTKNGYEKRVYHDQLVCKVEYQDLYLELKTKYKHWVNDWDSLDPAKHVYEDIGIATFLILLWKKKTDKEYQFVDLGCGNGFLVYILNNEGYKGYGIDLTKRKFWDKLNTNLIERPLLFEQESFDNVEWLIGNHPDELTLWIPIIASKCNNQFVVIPCCLHNLDGSKYTKKKESLGRFHTYIKEIKSECQELGYEVQQEHLRIPSTKNIALVSGGKTDGKHWSEYCTEYTLRKSDREKTFEMLKKKQQRSKH
ncbi:tRNA(Ser) Um(44) 2'-O-methyltransferase [Boothiomyces sp. JEL0866]|nr:tRNA(Ser) Um(44) 2'-O-methyltransferase [Boothiomyces sp. JEL0866]